MQPNSQLVLVSAGGVEPLQLADARGWLRVDSEFTDDDTLITALCVAARSYAEMFCRQSFLAGSSWRLTLNRFPIPMFDGRELLLAEVPGFFEGEFDYRNRRPDAFSIEISEGPIAAITSIAYIDATTGTVTTLDPSQYEFIANDDGGNRIYPTYGNFWPFAQPGAAAVTILYTTTGAVPPPVLLAMRQMVGHWYANREATVQPGTPTSAPLLAETLMKPYRLVEF